MFQKKTESLQSLRGLKKTILRDLLLQENSLKFKGAQKEHFQDLFFASNISMSNCSIKTLLIGVLVH